MEDSRLGREGELGLGLVIERRIKVGTCGGNGGGVSWKTLPASCGKNFGAAYHQINLSKGWARSWYAAPPPKNLALGALLRGGGITMAQRMDWILGRVRMDGLDGIGFGTGFGIGIGLGTG